MVAPDAQRIAVVADGSPLIVDTYGSDVLKVAPVDTIYKDPKPIGGSFFRDEDFQWSRDSKALYVIKDVFYDSGGSQLYSKKGELWRYDTVSRQLQPVLKPFPAYTYFFGPSSGIYFSVPTAVGNLHLKYFDGKATRDVGEVNAADILPSDLGLQGKDQLFFSFSSRDGNLFAKGVNFLINPSNGQQNLSVGGKTYLTLSRGSSFKGPYYCSQMGDSLFLPGNQFLLVDLAYCGNYKGRLLLDTVTGQYETMPSDTRVFLTMNTDTVLHYRITSGGITAR